MRRFLVPFRALVSATLLAALAGCGSRTPSETYEALLTGGTWGGENVGLLIGEDLAHVHFGCTYGNFPLPLTLDEDSRFNVTGEYVLRAYPVAVGPTMPAQLSGLVRGSRITLTVAVHDTVNDEVVIRGPATVVFGRDPEMGPCPICTVAPNLRPSSGS